MGTTTTFDAQTVKRITLGDLDQELAATRRMLERVPEEHYKWKPHEKSYSLVQLATHVANLPFWTQMTIEDDHYDVAKGEFATEVASTEELLAGFDERAAAAKQAVADMDAEALLGSWSLKQGSQVFFTMPRWLVLRSFCMSHLVHHRGQLSVYLRMLGVPLPQMYGPTADEPTLPGGG